MQSYARDGGLWDLEAELIDVKAYDFPKRDGEVFKAGDPIHHMHLRITIDGDFTIVAAQAVYDAAPYGGHCMAIEPAYTDLIGMNLLKGFRRQVKERFGHVAGCTHMTELSQVLPTAAVRPWPTSGGRKATPTGVRSNSMAVMPCAPTAPWWLSTIPSGTPGIALRHPPVRPPIHLLFSYVLTGNT